jgi:trans-aconitate 2-methyltransferase
MRSDEGGRVAEWDPTTYLRFADERARPFLDLLARVGAREPRRVVDLGCGPGNLTTLLAERWPDAEVTGIDSSPAMIERARAATGSHVAFTVGDLREWRPEAPVDVLVSNATLQWVPGHRGLLPGLVGCVRPGGWFAFQVPGNFDEPSHVLLRETAARAPYGAHTSGLEQPAAAGPEDYLADLTALGCRVDAWETTYLHVLQGPDPVFHWISATGARPVLAALPGGLREEFEREYKARLATAYPARTFGTVLPFRRVFVVARREEAAG